jgi:acyl-CoA synthetase (AMP-forming)/AMP-acid ligase II
LKKSLSPWGLFFESYEKYPDNNVIIYNDNFISYKQLYRKINEFCCLIGNYDFKTCAIFLPNSEEFLLCLLGLNKAGKVIIPLSDQLKGESLLDRINFSDAQFIITNTKGLKELESIEPGLNPLSLLVQQESGQFKYIEFKSQCKKNIEFPDDTFGICFSSGSTAKPKGVLISNEAIAGNAVAFAEAIGFETDNRFLISRSMAQAGPIAGDALMTISRGASIVLQTDLFHPAIFLKNIDNYKVTATLLVGTMFTQIIDYPKLNEFNIKTLKRLIYGGMSTPEKVIQKALERMPEVSFYCTYGMTEASTRVTVTNPKIMQEYPTSSGMPIRGCKVKILKEDGSEAKAGDIGEVYVVSDYLMKGYYKNTKLTEYKLTKNGLRTGDSGYVSTDNLLYICARNDNVIIQGGNNVFPAEIEDILCRNPDIKEAVVLGVEDYKLGQKIVAVVTAGDKTINEESIYRWCIANIEQKKLPKEIYIAEEIPKSDNGKIDMNELKVKLKNNMLGVKK